MITEFLGQKAIEDLSYLRFLEKCFSFPLRESEGQSSVELSLLGKKIHQMQECKTNCRMCLKIRQLRNEPLTEVFLGGALHIMRFDELLGMMEQFSCFWANVH